MSYNILSQELLQDNAYLYRHCEPGVLDWKHRLPSLLSEIRQHSADVSVEARRILKHHVDKNLWTHEHVIVV